MLRIINSILREHIASWEDRYVINRFMCFSIEAKMLGTYMFLGEEDQFTPVGFLEMTFMWRLEVSKQSEQLLMQRPGDLRGAGTTKELKEAQ